MAKTFTSKPIALPGLMKQPRLMSLTAQSGPPEDFERSYLELHGVDTVGASFVAESFNNPKADENTPPTPENGFAGSFSVFGHGGCGGDPGHCESAPGARPFDKRPQNVAKDTVVQAQITDALKKAIKEEKELTFTLVPVKVTGPETVNVDDPLKFKEFDISLRYRTPEGKTLKHQLISPQPAMSSQ